MARETTHLTSGRRSGGAAAFRHRAVAEMLRQRVLSRENGEKLPALREIATQLHVSTTTVRRALRTLEREGHIYQISGVGAFVQSPRPRRSARTVIAFAAADLSYPLEMGVAQGIQRACHERGWDIQLFDAHKDPRREKRHLMHLAESKPQGIIVVSTCSPENLELLLRLQSGGCQLVLVDRLVPGLSASLVQSDHERGAYLGTRYLISRGHRRILMLAPPVRLQPMALRVRGYERALAGAGLEPAPDWKVWLEPEAPDSPAAERERWLVARDAVLPVLRQVIPPVAVFAMRDHLAGGVYLACQELGLRIPDDVSVIGFDDTVISRALSPAVTVMSQRHEYLGARALAVLEEQLRCSGDGAGRPERVYPQILVDVDLIERESVAVVS